MAEEKNFYIGTAVSSDPFLKDTDYKDILSKEFNSITIDNELKFARVHPQKETYNFQIPDLIIDYSKKNGMQVRGHSLVWHKQIPDWLTMQKYTRDELKEILKQHIYTVVDRYEETINVWDVVNEAYDENGILRHNIWRDTIGHEYIELAFIWAHQANPNAVLFYNDYDIEQINNKSNAIYEMYKRLLNKGIPVGGIGFQFHTSINVNLDYNSIEKNFKRFSDLGVKIHVTEMDVKIQNNKDALQNKLAKQSEVYSNILNLCLENENCNSFTTWGFTDKYSWIPAYTGNDDSPLLFTNEYVRKPSYNALYKDLE